MERAILPGTAHASALWQHLRGTDQRPMPPEDSDQGGERSWTELDSDAGARDAALGEGDQGETVVGFYA